MLFETVGRFYKPPAAAALLGRARARRRRSRQARRRRRRCESRTSLSFDGLDTKDGLTRVAGNRKLYLKLLRQFAEQQGPAVEQITAALAQGDTALAERLAHTLKGVAGNIGAKPVQAAAGALEKLIRDRAAAAETESALRQVAAALDPLLAQLRDSLPSPEPTTPSPTFLATSGSRANARRRGAVDETAVRIRPRRGGVHRGKPGGAAPVVPRRLLAAIREAGAGLRLRRRAGPVGAGTEASSRRMKNLSDCRVLLVDDAKANLDILVEGLKSDHKLSLALNGEMALQIAARTPPDLVLLDIVMPGLDGYEVCRRLRQMPETAEVPIMFLSSLEEVQNKTRGFEAGANDYLTKPFEMLEVKARVRSLLKAKAYSDAVKEQIASELRVAREIQMGMLPHDFAGGGTGLSASASAPCSNRRAKWAAISTAYAPRRRSDWWCSWATFRARASPPRCSWCARSAWRGCWRGKSPSRSASSPG